MMRTRWISASLSASAALLSFAAATAGEPTEPPASLLRLTVDADSSREPPADELTALVLLGPGTDRVDLEIEAIEDTPGEPADGEPLRPAFHYIPGEGDAHRGPDGRFHLIAVASRPGGDALAKVVVPIPRSALRVDPTRASIRYTLTGRVGEREVFFASVRATPTAPLDGGRPAPRVSPEAPPSGIAAPMSAPALLADPGRVPVSPFATSTRRTILFATNRNVQAWAGTLPERFGDTLGDGTRYGSCVVNIPTEQRAPGTLRVPEAGEPGDPARQFFILNGGVQLLDEAGFRALVRGTDTGRDALVYAHGFNTSFEFAVVRMAQVVEDMDFAGAPVVFSWPSREVSLPWPSDYSRDEACADRSYGALARVLKTLAEEQEARPPGRRGKIHVIAHSMGNRVAMRALSILDTMLPPGAKPMGRIVLAAPDVSTEEFARLQPAIERRSERVSLYFNPNDQALWASFAVHGRERRAGNSPQFLAGLDNIDSAHVDTSLLGHGYWSSASAVLTDLRLLVVNGWEPARRVPEVLRVIAGPRPYWAFPVESWRRRLPLPW